MITDRTTFERIIGSLEVAAHRESRLPQQVFREGYSQFACIEFDLFSGDAFWSLLQRLAAATGDASIACVVLAPDPTEYFLKQFGMYGAIEINAKASADQYFTSMSVAPKASPADSLINNSEVLAWFSPSLEWLIWGERGLTVAMLGIHDRFAAFISSAAQESGIRLFSPEEAVSDLISANFADDEVPLEWRDEFLRQYGVLPITKLP